MFALFAVVWLGFVLPQAFSPRSAEHHEVKMKLTFEPSVIKCHFLIVLINLFFDICMNLEQCDEQMLKRQPEKVVPVLLWKDNIIIV